MIGYKRRGKKCDGVDRRGLFPRGPHQQECGVWCAPDPHSHNTGLLEKNAGRTEQIVTLCLDEVIKQEKNKAMKGDFLMGDEKNGFGGYNLAFDPCVWPDPPGLRARPPPRGHLPPGPPPPGSSPAPPLPHHPNYFK